MKLSSVFKQWRFSALILLVTGVFVLFSALVRRPRNLTTGEGSWFEPRYEERNGN